MQTTAIDAWRKVVALWLPEGAAIASPNHRLPLGGLGVSTPAKRSQDRGDADGES